ncbi:MAG: alpha/beta fold hydrolase [Nanoarchaeota archaeon]
MKFKKTISFILILILLGIVSRGIDTYSAKFLDARYQRQNGVIIGTEEIYLENGQDAILLIHGLTANPNSVREMANYLYQRGYTVYAPVIKGHGTSVFDLEKTNYLDWRKSAEDAYYKLAKNHKKIYVVGTSLGGLLSLDIASNHEVSGLIVVNTPMEINSDLIELLPLIYLVSPYNIRGLFSLEELPIATELKLYDTLPLKSVAQLKSYLEFVKPQLKKINSPIFVVQSSKDDIVKPESAMIILNNVNSSVKEALILEDSTHINIVNKEKELLKQRSYKFLKGISNF